MEERDWLTAEGEEGKAAKEEVVRARGDGSSDMAGVRDGGA